MSTSRVAPPSGAWCWYRRLAVTLGGFVQDFAAAIVAVDELRPVALNQRSKVAFSAGIGPHTEAAAIELVMRELANNHEYANYRTGVPYPGAARQKCDICLGLDPDWNWVIEAKLLRFLGDNGQLNDNMLMHILSPYPAHRSAVTDCIKLRDSAFAGRKAIMIYGVRGGGVASRSSNCCVRRSCPAIR